YGQVPPHHGMPKGHLPVRSYLAVPVTSRSGQVIGGLFFGHPESNVFSEKSERLVVGVAAQAAIAIDNARLYDAAQREIAERKRAETELAGRVKLASLRAEIGAAIALNESWNAILQRCTDSLVKHLDAAFARVWILNPHDDSVLELRASAGIYTHLSGPHGRIKVGEFKIGRIAQSRQPHLTNDVQHDSNISDPVWAQREGMVAFAGYPLVVEENVVGVIALFARHALGEEILKELSLIADGLAQWIQRRRAEEALRESERKLAEVNADLDRKVQERTASLLEALSQLEEFSYSVSHDLRAPLRAISGYNRIVLADYGATLPPDALQYLDKISRSAERMERLVNDVLTMSRVTRSAIHLHPVTLRSFIEEIIEHHPSMQQPEAIVTLDTPHTVRADGASLGQALLNLLSNAVKFVDAGEKATVQVRSEKIGDRVRIWIEDQGIGIPPPHREKLFGMFQRLPTARRYEGTGIGLAIVRKAVERMGGKVGMESNEPRGSRFWIELQEAQ
ncbi:MAG: ATP-binding protein, partial [Limisphaerales bacterium]